MNIPRPMVWLWNVLLVVGMLSLIFRKEWGIILISVIVGFILGSAAVAYERTGRCLPWAHDWNVKRVSVPLWDISARGELRTCTRCGKVTAR